MIPLPSLDEILEGKIGEGATLDFKKDLGSFDNSTKLDLVDDAVAFLNASGGTIIIGIAEHKGGLPFLTPLTGNPDKDALRLQDSLVDNIRERPSELSVEPMNVDGGYLLCVRIGRNTKQPYCNAVTGRYLQRRGRKNEPLMPGAVQALHSSRDRLLAALLVAEQERGGVEDDRLSDGVRLVLSILPMEHLNTDFPSFSWSRSQFSLKGLTALHAGGFKPFERVGDGYVVEAGDGSGRTIFRFEVRDDWLIRSTVVHPIPYREGEGRPEFGSMESLIFNHLLDVTEFITNEGIIGPFAVSAEISHLHSRDWGKAFFPRTPKISFWRPKMFESLDHVEMASKIVGLTRQSSIIG